MENTEDRINVPKAHQLNELEQYQQYQDLFKAVEDNHRKDTKRMYIFFVCILILLIFWPFQVAERR